MNLSLLTLKSLHFITLKVLHFIRWYHFLLPPWVVINIKLNVRCQCRHFVSVLFLLYMAIYR